MKSSKCRPDPLRLLPRRGRLGTAVPTQMPRGVSLKGGRAGSLTAQRSVEWIAVCRRHGNRSILRGVIIAVDFHDPGAAVGIGSCEFHAEITDAGQVLVMSR